MLIFKIENTNGNLISWKFFYYENYFILTQCVVGITKGTKGYYIFAKCFKVVFIIACYREDF